MQCPKCGFTMTESEKECPRCAGREAQSATQPQPSSPEGEIQAPALETTAGAGGRAQPTKKRRNIAKGVGIGCLAMFVLGCGLLICWMLAQQNTPYFER